MIKVDKKIVGYAVNQPEAEAKEAMHNEEQAGLLLSELRQLAKRVRKPAIDQDYL